MVARRGAAGRRAPRAQLLVGVDDLPPRAGATGENLQIHSVDEWGRTWTRVQPVTITLCGTTNSTDPLCARP